MVPVMCVILLNTTRPSCCVAHSGIEIASYLSTIGQPYVCDTALYLVHNITDKFACVNKKNIYGLHLFFRSWISVRNGSV